MNDVFATNNKRSVTKLIVIFYSFFIYFFKVTPPCLPPFSVSVRLIYYTIVGFLFFTFLCVYTFCTNGDNNNNNNNNRLTEIFSNRFAPIPTTHYFVVKILRQVHEASESSGMKCSVVDERTVVRWRRYIVITIFLCFFVVVVVVAYQSLQTVDVRRCLKCDL